MRKKLALGLALLLTLCLTAGLSACSGQSTGQSTDSDDTSISGKIDVKYTARDLDGTWDETEATAVDLSQGSYEITQEGVYVFSGKLTDGQILVNAGDSDKVQLVLAGAEVTCSDGPAILVENADKVFVTLAEGTENVLSDGSSYTSTEDQPWGAVFSRSDLTVNGSGTLTVNGNYMHGIVSKDDLRITGGTLNITAVKDGIRGRDSVGICDGIIEVNAGKHGIRSNNDEDDGKGYVSVDGGEISISGVSSQGIDAYYVAQMTGGKVTIDSENEGIQGKVVYLQDGELSITAKDDCLNATDGSNNKEGAQNGVLLEIAGGTIGLMTTAGDGLDSNGDLTVSGGSITISGSSSGVEVPIDYNGEGIVTGGTILAAGSGQMAQNFGDSSTQCSLMYSGSQYNSGTEISLLDADGQTVLSFTAEQGFNTVLITSPDLEQGATYTLQIGEDTEEITLESVITTEGTASMGGFGGGGRGGFGKMDPGNGQQGDFGGGQGGAAPDGDGSFDGNSDGSQPEMPDNMPQGGGEAPSGDGNFDPQTQSQ